jgi:hypothetical protein
MTADPPAEIVEAVRALADYEAGIADYVALARRLPSHPSPRRIAADRAVLADEMRRVRYDVRDMVREYTAALRASGVPPEQMVIGIKALTERALGRSKTPRATTLRADVLLWAIESYYQDAGQS